MLRRWLEHFEEGIVAFLLAAMTIVTFGAVVARYGFDYSFSWALELSIFLFGGIIFLGMSYGVRVGAHIGVDALVRILPKNIAHVVAILSTILCIVYASILLYGSWIYVDKMYTIGIYAQDVPIPQWVPRMVLPIGFGLLLFRFLEVLVRLLSGRSASLLGDEVADALKYRHDEE